MWSFALIRTCCVILSNLGPGMTYAVVTTSERVRTDKSDHCACARMRDMRLDESWTGWIWDHHSGGFVETNVIL